MHVACIGPGLLQMCPKAHRQQHKRCLGGQVSHSRTGQVWPWLGGGEAGRGGMGGGGAVGEPAQGQRWRLPLDGILTPIPGLCRLDPGTQICTSNFVGADSSRLTGLAGADPKVRGKYPLTLW